MSKAKKALSLFLAVVLTAVFALSVFFVVFESKHNCSGDDCQICQSVNLCLKLFDNKTPKPESANVIAALFFGIVLVVGAVLLCKKNENLITLKIKLSN